MAGTLKHLSQNEDQDLRMKRILILAVQPFQVWAETGNVSKLIRWQPSSIRPGVFEEETAWSTQHVVLRLVSKGLCDTCALGYVFSVPAPVDCAMCGRGWNKLFERIPGVGHPRACAQSTDSLHSSSLVPQVQGRMTTWGSDMEGKGWVGRGL